jgi:periplasmic copper chaperone A
MAIHRMVLGIVLGCLVLAGCSAGSSEPNVIVSGFAHPTAAEPTEAVVDDSVVGGVFLSIENRSSFPVRLISATTTAAGTVELHQSRVENDVMRMGIVGDGIDIAANSTLNFEDEGYHLMLIELTDELVVGDVIEVVLNFTRENGEPFEVTATVTVD